MVTLKFKHNLERLFSKNNTNAYYERTYYDALCSTLYSRKVKFNLHIILCLNIFGWNVNNTTVPSFRIRPKHVHNHVRTFHPVIFILLLKFFKKISETVLNLGIYDL